jgi:hypothetical protein
MIVFFLLTFLDQRVKIFNIFFFSNSHFLKRKNVSIVIFSNGHFSNDYIFQMVAFLTFIIFKRYFSTVVFANYEYNLTWHTTNTSQSDTFSTIFLTNKKYLKTIDLMILYCPISISIQFDLNLEVFHVIFV